MFLRALCVIHANFYLGSFYLNLFELIVNFDISCEAQLMTQENSSSREAQNETQLCV